MFKDTNSTTPSDDGGAQAIERALYLAGPRSSLSPRHTGGMVRSSLFRTMSSASDQHDISPIRRDLPIVREEMQRFNVRLGDQGAVERVAVIIGQLRHGQRVLQGEGQRQKAVGQCRRAYLGDIGR